jgi:hypothetical protein
MKNSVKFVTSVWFKTIYDSRDNTMCFYLQGIHEPEAAEQHSLIEPINKNIRIHQLIGSKSNENFSKISNISLLQN